MPIEFRDYYATLGVSREATADEIKQAFRRLARKYHPDVARDKRGAEEKFKEINEAHEVLGDPESRRKYDELGARWNEPGGRPEDGEWQAGPRRWGGPEPEFHFGGTGFSDFFEQFFGQGGFPGTAGEFDRPGARDYVTPRGGDIEGEILITLDEVMRGATRPIALRMTDAETGETDAQEFQVRIPPGAEQGRRIRVRGKGRPGGHGGERGELYLRVRYASHPDFTVRGADLHCELPLAPWEAVLGGEVRVPSLSTTLKLRVPAGTPQGKTFRLPRHGLLQGRSGERGDLYAVATIQVPSDPPPDERRLWEELRRVSRFAPRSPRR